jgi:hypothetical protein
MYKLGLHDIITFRCSLSFDPSVTTSSSVIAISLSLLHHLPVHVILQDRLGLIEQSLSEQRDSMTALHSKLDTLLTESKHAKDIF